jgi:ribosomal protein S18 acetylase RimI-like enzyme
MTVQTLPRPVFQGPGRTLLRAPQRAEAGEIGALLHHAFTMFQTRHGFASDFDSAESAAGFAAAMIDDPLCHAVVAQQDQKLIGVNFLSEGDPIRGVGPIAVAPEADDAGLGRRLMHEVIERAGDAAGVRLLQDSFNLKSLALYTTLGFRAREPYVVLKGRLEDAPAPGRLVRRMEPRDLPSVAALASDITGFPRGSDVRRALAEGTPHVVEHEGRLTGYATDLGSWAGGHAMAATAEDFRALVLGVNAADPRPLAFLFPTRQAPLLRWLFSQGLRGQKQMLLMTRGSYRTPAGIYLPSVLY